MLAILNKSPFQVEHHSSETSDMSELHTIFMWFLLIFKGPLYLSVLLRCNQLNYAVANLLIFNQLFSNGFGLNFLGLSLNTVEI